MRNLLPAALLAAVLAAVLAAPGAAHTTSDPTTVTIRVVERPAGDVFRGRVGSPDPGCVEKRRVRLFRVAEGPDTPIDSDRSEDDGAWDIDVEGGAPSGRYYVRVIARTATPAGHSHSCEAARSRLLTVD